MTRPKIVELSDLHFRPEEPFYSACKTFVDLFLASEHNAPENVLLVAGDILHRALSNGKTNWLMMHLFGSTKCKRVIIVEGNHDFSKENGSGLHPLRTIETVYISQKPEVLDILGLRALLMPFFYQEKGGPTMEERYSRIHEEFGEVDLAVGHFADPTQSVFKSFIDLSAALPSIGLLQLGHVHVNIGNYIGPPYITRYDERGKERSYSIIDPENLQVSRISVPVLLDYYRVEDKGPLPKVPALFPLWDVVGSEDVFRSLYPDQFIHDVVSEEENEGGGILTEEPEAEAAILDHFENFCEVSKIPQGSPIYKTVRDSIVTHEKRVRSPV